MSKNKYLSIMLKGLRNSSDGVQEDDLVCIGECIEDTYAPMMQEIEDRLGLELYDYGIKVQYDTDGIPLKYTHDLWFNFQEQGAINMTLKGVLDQLQEILEMEVWVMGLNLGIRVRIEAEI